MNDKEYELLEYVFQLAYSSAYSEEIKEISDLENKIIKKLESEDKAIEYIDKLVEDDGDFIGQISKYRKKELLEIFKGEHNDI